MASDATFSPHSSHLVVILLEEVELLLQAVQVSSQGGDDLVVVRLASPQSLTVPLHRLAQRGLGLPPAGRHSGEEGQRQHWNQFVPLMSVHFSHS